MTRQSLAHIALVVRDYDEAIDFYVGTLGFTLVADDYQAEQDKRWVLVAPSGNPEGSATILLISHRITTLSKADLILVLDKGRIVEQGSHEQLKHAGGIYEQICSIQSGTEEEAV